MKLNILLNISPWLSPRSHINTVVAYLCQDVSCTYGYSIPAIPAGTIFMGLIIFTFPSKLYYKFKLSGSVLIRFLSISFNVIYSRNTELLDYEVLDRSARYQKHTVHTPILDLLCNILQRLVTTKYINIRTQMSDELLIYYREVILEFSNRCIIIIYPLLPTFE